MDEAQQFFRGQRIQLTHPIPVSVSGDSKLLRGDIEGIIAGNHKDLYPDNGDNYINYYEVILIGTDGIPWGPYNWIRPSQFTLICDNRDKGKRIIQEYETKYGPIYH